MASTSVVYDILARDRASSKFDHLSGSVKGSSSMMSKFGGIAKTVATGALYRLGGMLTDAAAGALKMTYAAVEDAAAQELLKGALERNAGATADQVAHVEDWITAIGRAKGVADDDLRPALARLVTATGDVTEAQLLAQIAMDVSAGTGKSLESVSTALMKAQNGQVSSLSRLGINTKNAAGETISMKEATQRMTEQFGGAASAKAETFQGKMDRLKLALSEAGESIGTKLLPYAERFTDWLIQTAIPKVEKFIEQMKDSRGAGGRFADKLLEIRDALKKASKFVLEHKEDLLKLSTAFLTVRTSVKLLTIATGILNGVMAANPIGLVVVSLAALGGGFIYAFKHSERFRDAVNRVGGAMRDALIRAIDFANYVKGQFVGAIATIIGLPSRITSAFVGMWVRVSAIWAAFAAAVDNVRGKVEGLLSAASSAVGLGGLGGILGKDPNSRSAFESSGKSAADAWIGGLKKGVAQQKAKWLEFIGGFMSDALEGMRDAITDLRDKRNEFANFSGFRGNLFGADISGATGATTTKDDAGNDITTPGPTGVAALRAFAAAEAQKAKQLAEDVAKLTDMGISQDLLEDLKSQGASGLAQIHALASATQAEANEIFANMAIANSDYQKAGSEAATRMDEQLLAMGTVIAAMAREVTALVGAPPPTVNIRVDLEGKTIVKTVKAEERATNKTYWYPVRI